MPGPSQAPSPLISRHELGYTIHYDILGLTYWMLSRLEEVGRTDLDIHNRFPAASSHAYNHNYLERPIVDEWLDILGQVIHRQWPTLELKEHQFKIKISHDVDSPARYAFQSFKGLFRTIGGELIRRKNFKSTLLSPWLWLNSRNRIHPLDPLNTFDWIMRQSENNGLTSTFYFICGRTAPSRDALYEPDAPQIRTLMREIHYRGHEIGLHPSYKTYIAKDLLRKEADRLKRICYQEGIIQDEWGSRMHYLRWSHPETLRACANASLDYDSTLGYADHPGFRCGTCHEFPAFDPQTETQLPIRIRPLIAMECSITENKYLGLGSSPESFLRFMTLYQNCRLVRGTFTLLWHNSSLQKKSYRDLYKKILSSMQPH